MPCRDGGPGPNQHTEDRVNAICKNIVYLSNEIGAEIKPWASSLAVEACGGSHMLDAAASHLCELCKEAPDKIIYNGRDPQARKLADWWDEHKKSDLERLAKEKEEALSKDARVSALEKLTSDERRALGVRDD